MWSDSEYGSKAALSVGKIKIWLEFVIDSEFYFRFDDNPSEFILMVEGKRNINDGWMDVSPRDSLIFGLRRPRIHDGDAGWLLWLNKFVGVYKNHFKYVS